MTTDVPRLSRWKLVCRVLVAALPLVAVASGASANSILVTTDVDATSSDGKCSLREAIQAARLNTAVDACPTGNPNPTLGDVISLPDLKYVFEGTEEVGGGGPLTIQSISGVADNATVNLGGLGGFLYAHDLGGPLVLRRFSIINGAASVIGPVTYQGDLRTEGIAVTLDGMVLTTNTPSAPCGAFSFSSVVAGAGLSIVNSSFLSNTGGATAGAACIDAAFAPVSVRDTTFKGNSSNAPGAGALSVTVSKGSTFQCLRCAFESNAIHVVTIGEIGAGALYVQASLQGAVSLVDSSFIKNTTSGTSSDRAAALWVHASDSGTSVLGDRLFVDFNNRPNPFSIPGEDVQIQIDTGAAVTLRDSQVTLGSRSGIVSTVSDAGSRLTVGQATVADYADGTGILVLTFGDGGAATVDNTIFSSNGTNTNVDTGLTVNHSCNGAAADFVDEIGGDYHLVLGSTAIDAGADGLESSGLLDRDHRGRRAGAHPDCGAYEYDSLWGDGFESGDFGPSVPVAGMPSWAVKAP